MNAIQNEKHLAHSWGMWILILALALFLLLPFPLVDKFYAIGFGICPQRTGHSYFLGQTFLPGEASLRAAIPFLNFLAPNAATKMPVEARMYGMFAGFLLTWLYSFLIRRGKAALMPRPLILFLYIVFIAVMGADGINATIKDLHDAGLPVPYLYEPRLDLRFVTGWLCGIAMAGIILPVVNFCLWRDATPNAMFERLREMFPLLGIGILILILLTTGSGIFYYPLAVLAPVGILAILACLNVVLVLTLQRRERIAENWRAIWNPLALALILSLIELGALSAVRYLAFGLAEIG